MSAVEEQAAIWPPRVDGEWTVEDLLRSPDDGQRYEILDGVLLVSPTGPSVQVFDLEDAEYRLVAQGDPGDVVTVGGPLQLSFDPAVLGG